MTIRALILFGSHARRDSKKSSDVDILAVVEHFHSPSAEYKELSISFYSEKFLMKLAETGGLFALHLATEGRAIYDPDCLLRRMAKAFTRKPNYLKEVKDASMLGWFLLRHQDKVENWALFNKRIAWCVRTILCAKAYDEDKIIFSAEALTDFAESPDVEFLIKNKSAAFRTESTQYRFARFLRDFGVEINEIYNLDDIDLHMRYIFRSENIIGRSTISALFASAYFAYVHSEPNVTA